MSPGCDDAVSSSATSCRSLTERSDDIGADVAAQYNLIVRSHGDDQMRQLAASFREPPANQRFGLAQDVLKDFGEVLCALWS